MNNTQKAPYIKPKGKLAIDSWHESRHDAGWQTPDFRQQTKEKVGKVEEVGNDSWQESRHKARWQTPDLRQQTKWGSGQKLSIDSWQEKSRHKARWQTPDLRQQTKEKVGKVEEVGN